MSSMDGNHLLQLHPNHQYDPQTRINNSTSIIKGFETKNNSSGRT
jgi:hypothetical protein